MIFKNKFKLLALTSLIIPSQFIYAQSEKQNANLGEIVFFPQKDDVYNISSIQFSNANVDVNYGSDKNNKSNNKIYVVTYAHESHYSFYRNHTLGLKIEYQNKEINQNQEYKSTVKFSGLKNPKLIYSTRLLEQINENSGNLDFSAYFSPNLFPAKNARGSINGEGGSEGTSASGNNKLGILFAYSKNLSNANFLKACGNLEYASKSKSESAIANSSINSKPYTNGNIFLQGQKFINDKFGFSLKGTLSYVSEIETSYDNNGQTTETIKEDPMYSVSGEFKIDFIAIQNSFTLFSAFEYMYALESQYRNETYNTVGKYKNMYSTSIMLGTTYIL